jgi:indolepyruvate ferredoxin oxidoreductase
LGWAVFLSFAPDKLAQYLNPQPEPETLDQMIDRRVAFLTEYHNADYGADFAARISQLQRELPEASEDVIRTAARNLFRLMAYKDEFEVARLITEPTFTSGLNARFEGAPKLSYHMAPPLFSWQKDGRGRPRKQAIGAWVTPVLRGLARLRFLRGSALNPFGYHAEARLHRDLLDWYQGLLNRMIKDYRPEAAEIWQELLACADEIRGYGPVREASATTARKKAAQFTHALDNSDA